MNIFVLLINCAVMCYAERYWLHMLQLESYQLDGFVRFLKKNFSLKDERTLRILFVAVGAPILDVVLMLILRICRVGSAQLTADIIASAAFIAGVMSCDGFLHKQKAKKKFVLTARMKRLYAAAGILIVGCGLLLGLLPAVAFCLFAVLPLITYAAGWLMQPLEKAVSDYYLNDAKQKLNERGDLIKIGITGSYGKTSTKFILASILSEKYNVLATPASFNTPMGLTRVIREQLKPEHEVFLAEMGARHVGDIDELVELVHPGYGLITSVGPQHLETFGSIETVASTKYELVRGLPHDGVAFFASDDAYVDQLYRATSIKKYLTGVCAPDADMTADHITAGPSGSTFRLVDNRKNESVICVTRLLGLHNISNIVLACAVARELGLTMKEIASGVSRIEPIEHRLQLMNNGSITIIDDAFNSNPVGSKMALNVLKDFGGRHIIVTPGMVEQGERESSINKDFGRSIAEVCDEVILVGRKHTLPIREGLSEKQFPEMKIHTVSNLDEASSVLGQICRAGDTVLFENDLPDNYNEAK